VEYIDFMVQMKCIKRWRDLI